MYLETKTDDELYTLFEAIIDELNRRKSQEQKEELESLLEME